MQGLPLVNSGGDSCVCLCFCVLGCVCVYVCVGCYYSLWQGWRTNTLILTGSQPSVLLFWCHFHRARPWQRWTSCDDRNRERRKRRMSQHLSPGATGAKAFLSNAPSELESPSLSNRKEEIHRSRHGEVLTCKIISRRKLESVCHFFHTFLKVFFGKLSL